MEENNNTKKIILNEVDEELEKIDEQRTKEQIEIAKKNHSRIIVAPWMIIVTIICLIAIILINIL